MITNKHFIDWEAQVFGFGYGTGEPHILKALKVFLELCKPSAGYPSYKYEELEVVLGATTAWLLINALCHADCINYGTSTRYAWLDDKGKLLQEFVAQHTAQELYEMTAVDENYIHCMSGHCNCEPDQPNCKNPLFPVRR